MATLIWTGAAHNGDWNDPLNWSADGQPAALPPGAGDDVDMGGGPISPFPILMGAATVNSLTVDNTTTVGVGASLAVGQSLSVSATTVAMTFEVANAVQVGALDNLDADGVLSGGQRVHFALDAGGSLTDLDADAAAAPFTTLATNLSLGLGSLFQISSNGALVDVTASLTTVTGSPTLSNQLTLIGHNAAFAQILNVVSNGFILLVDDRLHAAGLVIDASSIVGGTGTVAVDAPAIVNNGFLWAQPQTAGASLDILSDVAGTGFMRVFDNSTLELAGGVGAGQTINFDNAENGEELIIDRAGAAGFDATLHNFRDLDAIELAATAATSATIDSDDKLHVFDGAQEVAALQLDAGNANELFAVTGDGAQGSLITLAANLPPVTTAPASETVSQGAPFAFAGPDKISVADGDANAGRGENILVVLTDTSGLLSAFAPGSGGGASVSGSGTAQLTISGDLAQVNAALATLSYLGSNVGDDVIDVAISDGRGGADDHKITISVVANQPPVTTAPAAELVSQNAPFAFTGGDQISVADADANAGRGETITVRLTDATGLLSAFAPGSGGRAGINGSGTSQLTISGSLGQVNTALATLSYLGPTVGDDVIDVATSDGRGGADDHKITISVVANQPPVTTVPARELVSQNSPFGFVGADQISVADADANEGRGETIMVTLTDTTGLLSASAPGSGGGAGVVGSGSQRLTISGSLAEVSAALATLSYLGPTVGDDVIDVATSDGRGGSDDHQIKISVVANQPPVTTAPASETIVQGATFDFSGAALISVADPDALAGRGETITVTLSDASGRLSAFVPGSGGGGSLTGNGTTQLTISGNLSQVNAALASLTFVSNVVGDDVIDVAISDGRGGSDDHKIAMKVVSNGIVPLSIAAPASVVVGVGRASPLAGLSLAGTQTPSETFTIVLSDVNGALSATTSAPGGGGVVTNSGLNSLTIAGTLAQVNADLTTLTATNPTTAADSLFILASDSNGETAAPASFGAVVNGLPTISTPSAVLAPLGIAASVPQMKVAETGDTSGETFVVTLSSAFGLFNATLNGAPVPGSGTNNLLISGTLDQVNAALATLTITETSLGRDFITGGVGDSFGNGSAQFQIPVEGWKAWTSAYTAGPTDWNAASNWTPAGPPVEGDNVFIPATGPQPTILDGASGVIGGDFINEGTITLDGENNGATMLIEENAILQGDGAVVLSSSENSVVMALAGAESTLTLDQPMRGSGIIALNLTSAQLTLINNSTLTSTGNANLLIDGGTNFSDPGQLTNAGLLEAANYAGLTIFNTEVTNNNGEIRADDGASVDLQTGANVLGGVLSTVGSGVIRSNGGVLHGNIAGPLTNLGDVEVGPSGALTLSGDVENSGTINLLGEATRVATLFFDQQTSLHSQGKVELSDSPFNRITGLSFGAVLDNNSTIEGAGVIDLGVSTQQLRLFNDVLGVIDANGSNALEIVGGKGPGVGGVTNNALIEATGAGGLLFNSVSVRNIGTIDAGTGSHVDLGLGATILGGDLETDGTGVIRSTYAWYGANSYSDAPLLDADAGMNVFGTVAVDRGTALGLAGDFGGAYEIRMSGVANTLAGSTQNSILLIEGDALLDVKANLLLTDSLGNLIRPYATNVALANAGTIQGAGYIELAENGASMSLNNTPDGTIDATGANALIIRGGTGSSGSDSFVVNNGLIEATGAGGLSLSNATVLNNGEIEADNNSHIDLGFLASLAGGAIRTSGTGTIRTLFGASPSGATLDGSSNGALNLDADVEIGPATGLSVVGEINNSGTINLRGDANGVATLSIDQSTATQGSGTIELSDSANNLIEALNTGPFIWANSLKIEGAGSIELDAPSSSAIGLQNEAAGVINATSANALKLFAPARSQYFMQNYGLIEATGTGGLSIASGSIANSGIIRANRGSQVALSNFQIVGGGRLQIADGATLSLLNGSIGAAQTLEFLRGGNETLRLELPSYDATTLASPLVGFGTGDQIEIDNLAFDSAALDASAVLHLFANGADVGSIQLSAANFGERFKVAHGAFGATITVAPEPAPPVAIALADDTGASATDRITKDAALTGSGDPFTVVTMMDGARVLGFTTADASGAWSFAPSGLSQGAHTITASESDAYGTGSASLAFTYDTVAPSVAITTPDAQIAIPTFTISGTGEAGSTVQLFDNTIGLGGPVKVAANGQWSEQVTLAGTGAHFITANDTDVAGNVGGSDVATFTLANQIIATANAPVVTGTSGADHITISATNLVVNGGAGNDTITLLPGALQIHLLNGGPGSDTLDLSRISGGVTVNFAQGFALGAQLGFSILNSIENVTAGTGTERITGSAGPNVFQAGSGADTFTGHGGGDAYVFNSSFGSATITDFHISSSLSNPHDTIQLDRTLFPQFASVQALLSGPDIWQSGQSVVISPGGNHSIVLEHSSLQSLLANPNDLVFA